ncbi:MAG: hypothetical protein PHF29_08715 [Candidatus Riflebacteria bacterium]|nr:hypothetical protein [Candidatus Riflebacteria bacterium]
MAENQEKLFADFINTPSSDNALKLVLSFKDYINRIAWNWNNKNLSYKDKVKELICEMFLILLEKFDSKKNRDLKALMLYLHLKLKKTIMQPFSQDLPLTQDYKLVGRQNFTYSKIEYSDTLFQETRKTLLAEQNFEAALLYFLFIHVYPDTKWASRILSEKFGFPNDANFYETNRKRIYRFNHKLRENLQTINTLNWHKITEWSVGERNHLAWRIIFVSPTELADNLSDELKTLDLWHASFHKDENYCHNRMSAAEKVYSSMKINHKNSNLDAVLKEDTEYWQDPPDILGILLGKNIKQETSLYLNEQDTKSFVDSYNDPNRDFEKIAEDMTIWFEKLLKAKLEKLNKEP